MPESSERNVFASIEQAILDIREGRMVILVDDEDRENEGDLTMAAEAITTEAVNFMAVHGRGLVCVSLTNERADELDLPPMVSVNTASLGTAFTVSVDAKKNVTTGISAGDRAETIRQIVDPGGPTSSTRPGSPATCTPSSFMSSRWAVVLHGSWNRIRMSPMCKCSIARESR